MGSYKKIGLSHEMGLIDTPPLIRDLTFFIFFVSFLLFSSFLLSFVQENKTNKKNENNNIM